MTAPALCEPPAEHAHHCWHWLVHEDGERAPFRWDSYFGRWDVEIDSYPEDMADLGWRYLAPAVPPELSE